MALAEGRSLIATVYVTIASVLLGLALEDLVSLATCRARLRRKLASLCHSLARRVLTGVDRQARGCRLTRGFG